MYNLFIVIYPTTHTVFTVWLYFKSIFQLFKSKTRPQSFVIIPTKKHSLNLSNMNWCVAKVTTEPLSTVHLFNFQRNVYGVQTIQCAMQITREQQIIRGWWRSIIWAARAAVSWHAPQPRIHELIDYGLVVHNQLASVYTYAHVDRAW